MKKFIMAAVLVASVAALSACSTAQSSEGANSGSAVMEKRVTK